MTKVIRKETKKETQFGCLEVGDCFLDEDNSFCIKVNSTTCLFANEELGYWEEWDGCINSDIVFPINTEIHIVS